MPVATLAPLGAKQSKVRSVRDFSPQSAGGVSLGSGGPHRLSSIWLVVPFALIGSGCSGSSSGASSASSATAGCRARAAARCRRFPAAARSIPPMALELGRVTDRKPPFKYSSLTRVGFSDTDAQGIVYYGRYLPYFDSARVEYHRHLELLVTEPREHEFVMRANTIEYHAPARFDDLIEVFIRVSRIGRTSVTYEHAAYRAEDDVLMVTATQTLVLVDLDERRACPVPDWYREQIAAFEGEDLA